MSDKTKILENYTFVPVGDGWFNYFYDMDDDTKFYKQPCVGFIHQDGEWLAASIDGGYAEIAINSVNYIRTGRGNDWVEVDKDEAVM